MKTSIALVLAALLGAGTAVLVRQRSRRASEAALWAAATDPLPRVEATDPLPRA